MAIKFGQPPEASLQALGEISKLRPGDGGGVVLQDAMAKGAGAAEPLFPHKAFRFLREDVQARRREAGAREIGWHYLIDTPSLSPSVAEVADLSEGPVLSKLTEGRVVGQTVDRLKALLEEATGTDLELATLSIPELSVSSLWLRGADRSQDRYLPIQTPAAVSSDREYGSDEFWEAMEKLADDEVFLVDAPTDDDRNTPTGSGGQTNEL